jgi:SAM-dependent methyltransferase
MAQHHERTTMTAPHAPQLWYPPADPARQPSPWWYFGRAVYVSRRDYGRIFRAFLAVGLPLGTVGVLFKVPLLFRAAQLLAGAGLGLLAYSLVGLYRMYGHPATAYLRQLLELGQVSGPVTVADLHIGTYRHSYLLAELLPQARIYSVDCWKMDGPPAEEAVEDVRGLEPPPAGHPRIQPLAAQDYAVPLPDGSCDVLVFGFGTHEIPAGAPRERLFEEARRLLRPGGTVLLFEHGYDLHNYIIFGPVIEHVTPRETWEATLRQTFTNVRYARSSHAVDLFAAVRGA